MFKLFPHKKDEALAFDIPYVEGLPIAPVDDATANSASILVASLSTMSRTIRGADHAIADWLRHEMGLAKLPASLAVASRLNSDSFVASVRASLPKRAGLSPSRLAQLRAAFADIAEPARLLRASALGDERALSDIVNRAYGLTPDDIALMWRTAPPRMPLAPPRGSPPASSAASTSCKTFPRTTLFWPFAESPLCGRQTVSAVVRSNYDDGICEQPHSCDHY